ncbi:MAG TPA: hypothetical protein VM577_09130 [Anaerovoracaceae bacterium]|nr:hypothetical protein [Anaerovoracaceae bacterium]
MPEPKVSFEDSEVIPEATKTVKLDSKKSKFAKQLEGKQVFEKRAEVAHQKMMGRQEEIYLLGSKFVEMMKDKTLPENKGPIQQSLEKEILGKLINFAIDLNNDMDEPKDSMGSIGLLALVFKSTLVMRDKYNLLEYKVEQLERQLKSSQADKSNDK